MRLVYCHIQLYALHLTRDSDRVRLISDAGDFSVMSTKKSRIVLALLRGHVSRWLNRSVHLSPESRWPAGRRCAATNGTRVVLCPRCHATVIITVAAASLSRAPHKGCVRATMVRVPGINTCSGRCRVSPTADRRAEMTPPTQSCVRPLPTARD